VIADAVIHGRMVPTELLGELTNSMQLLAEPAKLRAAFERDGYAFFRGVLDRDLVQSARGEVLSRLEAIDEIELGTDGVATGRSERDALHADRGEFWSSVSAGDCLRRVSHGPGIRRVLETLVGEAVVPFDYLMLRVATPGRATEVHYDYPFFARVHDQVRTVWTPIGDVPVERGPLFVIEGSNRFADLIEPMLGFDVAEESVRTAAFDNTAIEIAEERQTRLLSTDFAAGDVLVFGMYTAHGSFDHHDDSGRARVSCDARWQAARLDIDERYMGDRPQGTTGAGYAELNGAKPLTEQWHVR
jgi:ectoine hydroxylase-related dioxygenase (phytanoyl-CoA dioxygenase family)